MSNRRGHSKKPKTPKKNGKPKDERVESTSQLHSQLNRGQGTIDVKSNLGTPAKVGILSNPANSAETAKDIALVEKAVREKWGIKNKERIQHRLLDVVNKTSVVVLTKAGPFDSEEAADANAIAASKVLVQMNGQDQDDEHFDTKLNKEPLPTTVVNVSVDSSRSRLLELANKLGARELIVDGKAIPTAREVG